MRFVAPGGEFTEAEVDDGVGEIFREAGGFLGEGAGAAVVVLEEVGADGAHGPAYVTLRFGGVVVVVEEGLR